MANQDQQTALGNLGNALAGDLIASLHRYGRVASGKTANSIQVTVLENRMYIVGSSNLVQLELGRRPTGAGGPVDRQSYDGLSFKESLNIWMQSKGIDKKFFYPIYRKINEEGFAGTPGLITKPLSNDNINKQMDKFLGPVADLYAKQVINLIFK